MNLLELRSVDPNVVLSFFFMFEVFLIMIDMAVNFLVDSFAVDL